MFEEFPVIVFPKLSCTSTCGAGSIGEKASTFDG
jgi:hypothetical protein